MSDVHLDTSDLKRLGELIDAAVTRTLADRTKALHEAADTVRDRAAAIAASYPHATGALAQAVTVGGSDLTRTIGSNLREGYFLEVGSPTTGGPRPWLTQPARDEANALLRRLGEIGELW